MAAPSLHGIININKPAGITSRDVVNVVQRLGGRIKAGHAGTLDPLAAGVLVLCVGAATRLIDYVQRTPKHYAATFLLGRSSPTEDIEGPVTELPAPPIPTREQLEHAAAVLTGPILQRPPAYSALKVQGRRAYDLARAGKAVELAPRPITIYGLEVGEYQYPSFGLRIECSSGTYVRSLGRDLAESLGTAAVMSQLTRTAVGAFRLEEAVELSALSGENWRDYVLPPLCAVDSLPRVELGFEEARRVRAGQAVRGPESAGEEIAALDDAGRLVAILVPRGAGQWGPKMNFPVP